MIRIWKPLCSQVDYVIVEGFVKWNAVDSQCAWSLLRILHSEATILYLGVIMMNLVNNAIL